MHTSSGLGRGWRDAQAARPLVRLPRGALREAGRCERLVILLSRRRAPEAELRRGANGCCECMRLPAPTCRVPEVLHMRLELVGCGSQTQPLCMICQQRQLRTSSLKASQAQHACQIHEASLHWHQQPSLCSMPHEGRHTNAIYNLLGTHLAAEVVVVGRHGQRQAHVLPEEFLHARRQAA